MTKVHLGNLSIGEIPRVVGTLAQFESLSRFPSLSPKPCDIAEARLDLIGHTTPWLPACQQIERSGTPVILTFRTVEEGGKCDQTPELRKQVLMSALGSVSAVDVELTSGLAEELGNEARRQKKAIIVSYHNFVETPGLDALKKVVAAASEFASIVKVSTMINSDLDSQTLQKLLLSKCEAPICVIGMGPLGTPTRTAFPALGSALTYGYVDSVAAPGQISAQALVDHLRLVNTRYNETWEKWSGR